MSKKRTKETKVASEDFKVEGFEEDVIDVPLDGLESLGVKPPKLSALTHKAKVKVPTSSLSKQKKIELQEYMKLTMPWYKRIWYKLFHNKSKDYAKTAETVRDWSFGVDKESDK